MQSYDQVTGHADIIAHMKNSVAKNKISHAYLLGGEEGSGKKMLASLFAVALQCEKHGPVPCMACVSCRKAASGNHPDIIYVNHEKPNMISIDEIREQVVGDVAIRPYESRWKIYLIDQAQKMTPQAQNALLKTIEEPPSYAVIMLLADNTEALLPTILSRCVQLKLKPLSDKLVKGYLMKEMHIPDYQAEVYASFAQGNIGKARRIASSEEYAVILDKAIYVAKYADSCTLDELVEKIRELNDSKDQIADFLDILTMWFRDVLMFKATRDVDGLVFREEINAIRERSRKSSYEGLEIIIQAVSKAAVRLNANVNFDLTMELLLLAMKEN